MISKGLENTLRKSVPNLASSTELVNLLNELGVTSAGSEIFFVDSVTGSSTHDGLTETQPAATLAQAYADASAGDIIILFDTHAESTATAITLATAGVKIIGLGTGARRATFTGTGTVDVFDLTGASQLIENIRFAASTAAVTAHINIGAANCIVRNCEFLMGASDTNASITIPDAGDECLIEGNEWRITANGPAIAISIESASTDRIKILNNFFNGGSTTNKWDTAAINSSVAHTNAVIANNRFLYGTAHDVASSVSTVVRGNDYGVDAVPNSAAPMTFYCDNGSTVRDGRTPATPTTVANAITQARASSGDTILLLPGTYTLTAALAMSKAAVRLGPAIDNGTFNVTITTASDVDLVTLTGANCEIWGLKFLANAAQTTTPMIIDLDTGDFCRIHHCYFDAASVASLVSIDIASTATDTTIDSNYFVGQAATVGSIVDLGARTKVLDNMCNQLAADGYFINNDGLATGGALYLRNYILGDGGAGAAMCLFDTSAPVQFLFAHNIFGGTTSATPFGQDAEFTTMFVNNYCPGSTVAGGTLIDPVA